MKTLWQAIFLLSHILLRNHPGQPPPLPRTRYQERRTSSLKIKTGLGKPETSQLSQLKAKTLYVTPDSGALSQWLTYCDMPVTMTDILWQIHHNNWHIAPSISTISILSLSFLHLMKKKEDMAAKQRRKNFKASLLGEENRVGFHPKGFPYL